MGGITSTPCTRWKGVKFVGPECEENHVVLVGFVLVDSPLYHGFEYFINNLNLAIIPWIVFGSEFKGEVE
jgi:hypothetical protein